MRTEKTMVKNLQASVKYLWVSAKCPKVDEIRMMRSEELLAYTHFTLPAPCLSNSFP